MWFLESFTCILPPLTVFLRWTLLTKTTLFWPMLFFNQCSAILWHVWPKQGFSPNGIPTAMIGTKCLPQISLATPQTLLIIIDLRIAKTLKSENAAKQCTSYRISVGTLLSFSWFVNCIFFAPTFLCIVSAFIIFFISALLQKEMGIVFLSFLFLQTVLFAFLKTPLGCDLKCMWFSVFVVTIAHMLKRLCQNTCCFYKSLDN